MSNYTNKVEVDLGEGQAEWEAEIDITSDSASLTIELDDSEPVRIDLVDADERRQLERIRAFLGEAIAAGERMAVQKVKNGLSAAKPRAFVQSNGGSPERLADGTD